MVIELRLYTRRDCELCHEMEETLAQELARVPANLETILVDGDDELEKQFGQEVPVLFVNGRKAFKFRVTPRELRRRIAKEKR